MSRVHMFWKKQAKISKPLKFEAHTQEKRSPLPYPKRLGCLYISTTYKEILFVPMGKMNSGVYAELPSVTVNAWPMNIGDLQECIVDTLDTYKAVVDEVHPSKENWHSFNASKAKTQNAFTVDYIQISLITDVEKPYIAGETERILVEATPFNQTKDSYVLMGKDHLIETRVAQLVIDIFNACEKIRTN